MDTKMLIKMVYKTNELTTYISQRRVSLRPHHSAWPALNRGVIHGLQGTLSISMNVEVHVGVPQRTSSNGVSAHTHRGQGAHGVEDLKQEGLSHVWVQVAHVQGTSLERGRLSFLS